MNLMCAWCDKKFYLCFFPHISPPLKNSRTAWQILNIQQRNGPHVDTIVSYTRCLKSIEPFLSYKFSKVVRYAKKFKKFWNKIFYRIINYSIVHVVLNKQLLTLTNQHAWWNWCTMHMSQTKAMRVYRSRGMDSEEGQQVAGRQQLWDEQLQWQKKKGNLSRSYNL